MIRVEDPRTGRSELIRDLVGYRRDMASRRLYCDHKATELRRWGNAGGGLAIQAQCKRCGWRIGGAVRVDDRDAYPPADDDLKAIWEGQVRSAIDGVRIKHIDETKLDLDERGERYQAYLKTDAWRARRDLVLTRCGEVCEGCAAAPATVVHHLSYEHIYEELLFELVGVCRDCHERCHPEKQPGGTE